MTRFLYVAVLALVLWGAEYVRRDLWEPDEARYAYVAWEMAETGRVFVPQRNGEAYSHKPPLMFWLIRAASIVTGGVPNGLSARLPSLLGGILALWVIAQLGQRWFGTATGWLAPLVCAATGRFWHQGGWGQIDMLLCGLVLAAVYLLFRYDEDRAQWRAALAFCCMGLGILAKGPVGLIVPVGIYIGGNLAAGELRRCRHWAWAWGLPLALLWPAAWLGLAALEGAPGWYFEELFFAQTFSRAAGQFGGHAQPLFYYLLYVPLDFMPWTVLVPAALAGCRRLDGPAAVGARRLAGWILFVFVFFSLCGSKRALYILSIYPAAALLVAVGWQAHSDRGSGWTRVTALVTVVLVGAAALKAVLLPSVWSLPVPTSAFLLPAALAVGTAVALVALALRCGTGRTWLTAAAAGFLLIETAVGAVTLPALNPLKTPRPLVPVVREHTAPGQRLILYRIHGEILALYARRQGIRINHFAELVAEMVEQHTGVLVCRSHEWDALAEELARFGPIGHFTMGSKHFIWQVFDMSTWPPVRP